MEVPQATLGWAAYSRVICSPVIGAQIICA